VPELDSATDLKPPFTTFNREDGSEGDPAAPEFREGLPKTYRPRHDLHYVEQLTATDAQPVRLVPVSRIDSGDLPPEHTVASLADSIAELGIVQPLLVRPHNGRFRLIAGRRRLAAARRAGLTEVPCLVHAVNETRASQLATADNLRPAQVASPLSLLASPPDVQADIDGHTAAMMSELQDAVASLQSCLPLLARATSTREQVALKLLTVESERAAWVIRARRYLAGTLPVAHTPVGGAALLDQVKRQAGMSMALRGGALQVDPVRSAGTARRSHAVDRSRGRRGAGVVRAWRARAGSPRGGTSDRAERRRTNRARNHAAVGGAERHGDRQVLRGGLDGASRRLLRGACDPAGAAGCQPPSRTIGSVIRSCRGDGGHDNLRGMTRTIDGRKVSGGQPSPVLCSAPARPCAPMATQFRPPPLAA
jgi:hypothetical protein